MGSRLLLWLRLRFVMLLIFDLLLRFSALSWHAPANLSLKKPQTESPCKKENKTNNNNASWNQKKSAQS